MFAVAEVASTLHTGDRVLYMGRRGTWVCGNDESSVVHYDFDKKDHAQQPTAKLEKLPEKATRLTTAMQADPQLLPLFLEEFLRHNGRLLISCQASVIDKTAARISAHTRLSALDAIEYISPASEKSHAAKFYIVIDNAADSGVLSRIAAYFGVWDIQASIDKRQLNAVHLALWLMDNGVLPGKRR